MTGLLGDAYDDPKTQGLLTLGLGLLGGRGSFTDILGAAGRDAMGAYHLAGRARDERERAVTAQQLAKLHRQQQEMEIARAQAEEAQRQAILAAAQRNMLTGAQTAMAAHGGPTRAAAAAAPSAPSGFNLPGFTSDLMGIDPLKGIALQQALRKEAPKLKSVEPMRDPATNRLVNVALYDDGTTRILPYGVKPDMVTVDAKNRSVFMDKNAVQPGDAVKYGASPDAQLKATTDREANEINRQAARTQIVPIPGGGIWAVDKGKNTAAPVKMSNGQNMPDEATAGAEKRNAQLKGQLELAEKFLKEGPTGSYAGAGVDQLARIFGASTAGADKAAQLDSLSGWLVSNVPRMEGPQSNVDVLNYQIMAGQVGDRTLPVATRIARVQAIKEMLGKYEEVSGVLKAKQVGAPPTIDPGVGVPAASLDGFTVIGVKPGR